MGECNVVEQNPGAEALSIQKPWCMILLPSQRYPCCFRQFWRHLRLLLCPRCCSMGVPTPPELERGPTIAPSYNPPQTRSLRGVLSTDFQHCWFYSAKIGQFRAGCRVNGPQCGHATLLRCVVGACARARLTSMR
jgi:hypothetical protein